MSVLNKVTRYQRKIEKYKEHTETLIYCINKLHKLPITVRHLEKTGIGKTINELRKFDGDVGNAAKALVWKWKRAVFVETLAEQAGKERVLMNPIVSNSDENVLNVVKSEEEGKPTILSSTAGNDGIEVLQDIYEGHSSIANLNCNVSEYESHRSDTLNKSTEGEDKATKGTSHVFAINQSNPKTEKQKDRPRHSGKHHNRSRRDKPQHNKKGKEVDRSELKIKEDCIKIKLKKVHTGDDNKQEEKKSVSSGPSSKHKHCSKRAENETKCLESKHCRKERGQKRKSSLSKRSTENIPKQSKSTEKVKEKMAFDGSVDYFAEALRMGDVKENKRSSSTTTSTTRNSDSKSSPGTRTTSTSLNSLRDIVPSKPDHWLADVKFDPMDVEVDLASILSERSPNYNPLPHLPLVEEDPALKHAAKQVPLPKQHRQRMKVYSGVKAERPIPTLYNLCVHVLKEHIDALQYTGGVPYDILKPILQQATPEQLFQVEYYNSYLIEDTNELWEFHCRKQFRSGQLQPMESAREMYLRCLEEREAKLKALTCNIQQSLTKSQPVRQMKLAYVDSDPKPPRNVAKEQAKYGTGGIPKSGGKPQRRASVIKPLTSKTTFNFLKKSNNSAARTKPRFAPLIQKI